ncbi:MAG: hypothetical protein ABIN55_13605 [Aeromicrobium sp.]
MVRRRIVVGAIGKGEGIFVAARALRDEGREVVLVGGGQSPEQLIRTAVAEDADELVIEASENEMTKLEAVREELGAEHLRLTALDSAGVTDSTRQDPQ